MVRRWEGSHAAMPARSPSRRRRNRASPGRGRSAYLLELGLASASIAHEIANTLTPLAGLARHAAVVLPDGGHRILAEKLVDACDRVTSLAGVLLRPLNPTTPAQPPASCDLREIVHNAVSDILVGQDQTRIRVDVPEAIEVRIDGAALHHVLTNLLRNALRASRGSAKPVHIRVAAGGSTWNVHLEVVDCGGGMSAAEVKALRSPQRRTIASRDRTAHGVGIHICRRLLEHHGAALFVRSQPRIGTTFVIQLRRARRLRVQAA